MLTTSVELLAFANLVKSYLELAVAGQIAAAAGFAEVPGSQLAHSAEFVQFLYRQLEHFAAGFGSLT